MLALTSLLALAGFLSSAAAHGVIVSPPPRTPGDQYSAVCGQTIYNNQASDQAGPIQLLMQSESSITDQNACDLWLCKGYKFEDNTANVQTYTRGQTVPFEVDIRAPHTGYANVSIVDTKSNTVIGSALKSWESYASTSTGVKADETNFEVTVPSDLEGCTEPGECVMQWFWYAPPGVDQTYEGCIDFVVSGGAGAPAASSSAQPAIPSSTAAAAPNSTSVAEPTTAAEAPAPTEASEVPATSSVPEVVEPTTAVSEPTTSVEIPASSVSAEVPTTNTTIPTTAALPPVTTTAIPTTLVTRTRSQPAPISTGTGAAGPKTPQSINQCLDNVNDCIRKANAANQGGGVDFSSCEAQRAACY